MINVSPFGMQSEVDQREVLNPELRELAVALRTLRIERGLRQVDLAVAAQVPVRSLRHLEQTGRIASSDLARVLTALGRWQDVMHALQGEQRRSDGLLARARRSRRSAPRAWAPVLHGRERLAALDAARSLVEGLPPAQQLVDPSLVYGAAGLGLACALLFTQTGEPAVGLKARSYFERSKELVDFADSVLPGLFSGMPGIAWSWAVAAPLLGARPDASLLDRSADLLQEYVDSQFCTKDVELVDGLAGMGLFACVVPSTERRKRLAASIYRRVIALAERSDGGLTWRKPIRHGAQPHDRASGAFTHNMGLAHGVLGVISMLSAWRRTGIAPTGAERALAQAERWYQIHCARDGAGVPVAPYFADAPEAERVRLAWCYGDLGAVAALSQSAFASRDEAQLDALWRWLDASLGRPDADSFGLTDVGICHGTAGLATILHRLGVDGRYPAGLEGARRFYLETIRRVADDVSAVPATEAHIDDANSLGFLTGSAGTVAALVGAVSDFPPVWHGMMGITVPVLDSRTSVLSEAAVENGPKAVR